VTEEEVGAGGQEEEEEGQTGSDGSRCIWDHHSPWGSRGMASSAPQPSPMASSYTAFSMGEIYIMDKTNDSRL
jgi:hypothetical protein